MPKKMTPSFIHTFELRPLAKGQGSFHDLYVSADSYRKLYNAILGKLYTAAKKMKASEEWQEARKLPKNTKERAERFEELRHSWKLTKNDTEKLAKELVSRSPDFKVWTNSAVVQKVAERALRAVDRFLYAKAKRVRFKRKQDGFNFEGKSNQTGVRIVEADKHFLCIVGHRKFAMVYDIHDSYDVHALSSRCKYARILFKSIKGKERVFVQGVFEGLPFEDKEKQKKHQSKLVEKEGEDYLRRKEQLPAAVRERVAYDIGPKNIAISTALISYERPLCEGIDTKQKEIRRLQRALDRSRRKTNPKNYHEDGSIRKGPKVWNFSKQYLKKRAVYADLERRKLAERKSSHGNLCHEILSYGNLVHTEQVSIKGWQKRWGRSIGHHAPSALTSELTRKAEYARGRLEKICTRETALSQHCVCGHREKKKLSDRIHICHVCGLKAKRDSLSAYLAIFCEYGKLGEGKYGWRIHFADAIESLKGHRTLSLNAPHDAMSLISHQAYEQKTMEPRALLPPLAAG
jgi:transposase